jgi:membrane-associated phospholipid phosphatase
MTLRPGTRLCARMALLCLLALWARPTLGDPSAPPGVTRDTQAVRAAPDLELAARPPTWEGWQPTTVAALFEEAEQEAAAGDLRLPEAYARPPLVTNRETRAFVFGAALLAATDRTTIRWFDPDIARSGPSGDEGGKSVSRLGTGLPLLIAVALPAMLDGHYGRKTSGWAAVALVDATILTTGLKFLTGKERPSQSGGQVRFHGPSTRYSSFPSGHASAAFAVATVLGTRYRKYRLPLYLLAGAVAWARVNAARHFPSDVFVGAGIGIYSGRYVLRHGGRLWSIRF